MMKAQDLHAEDIVLKTDLFTPEAMLRVGAAFAPLLKRDWGNTNRTPCLVERYGLIGPSDSGKSVFLRGLISAFDNAIILEDNSQYPFKDKVRPQKLYQALDTGFIRLRDAELTHMGNMLLSHEQSFLESGKVDGIDIVENAQLDYDETGFSAVWQFNHNANAKRRELVLYASPGFRSDDDFQKFKEELAVIKAEMP